MQEGGEFESINMKFYSAFGCCSTKINDFAAGHFFFVACRELKVSPETFYDIENIYVLTVSWSLSINLRICDGEMLMEKYFKEFYMQFTHAFEHNVLFCRNKLIPRFFFNLVSSDVGGGR